MLLLAVAAGFGTLGGFLVSEAPRLIFGGAVALVAGGIGVAMGSRLRTAFLLGLGLTLGGYAFYGRPFSYIGIRPFFIGEVMLGVGLFAAGAYGQWRRVFAAPLAWVTGLYVLWGAVCTVPYLSEYRTEALRDAVIWGYALFAAVVAACLRTEDVERGVRGYRHCVTLLPAFALCLFTLNRLVGESAPSLPWADVSILHFKPTDAAVHLGGSAAFLLLGLSGVSTTGTRTLCWGVWLIAAAVVTSQSRGGLLALATAVACAALFGSRAAKRRLLSLSIVSATALFLLLLVPWAANNDTDARRAVSLQQVAENLTSIAGFSSHGDLEGTKSWRIAWWQDIASYTVHGRHFWRGKGFGVNLADADGFQVMYDASLRSPHNIHMTVLARAGVPGLTLWVLVLGMFCVSMAAGIWRARLAGQEWWSRVCAWILAYWLAMVVDASFDVYLEGPAGGIWFWSLTGLGVAVLDMARRERRLVLRASVQTLARSGEYVAGAVSPGSSRAQ